jgi:hypothetical protein
MSLNNQDSDNQLETPPSKEEEQLKENEVYSCTECDSNIEIQDLDEDNILTFKCHIHGIRNIQIKEYFEKMKKNTFYYSKCSKCKKAQNEVDSIFKYCCKCNLVICNKCISEHDKEHFIIDNNKLNIKCLLHPKLKNQNFCLDCNTHLCQECLLQRKHMMHKKINIIEIKPSNDEINFMLKLINEYKKKLAKVENEKQNKLIELEKYYKKQVDFLKNYFGFTGNVEILLSGDQNTNDYKEAQEIREAKDNINYYKKNIND